MRTRPGRRPISSPNRASKPSSSIERSPRNPDHASICGSRRTCCRRCRIPWPRTRAGLAASPGRPCRANSRVDVWHCEWTPYAEMLRGIVTSRRVVMAHNVESVIWQRYHENESNPLRRWYIGRQWRKFQRFERRVLGAVERTIAVSDMDAQRFREDFGVSARGRGRERRRYRCISSRKHAGASRDACCFSAASTGGRTSTACSLLLERVFPAVRAAEPSASLCLGRTQSAGGACGNRSRACLASSCMAVCRMCGPISPTVACSSCRCASAAARG